MSEKDQGEVRKESMTWTDWNLAIEELNRLSVPVELINFFAYLQEGDDLEYCVRAGNYSISELLQGLGVEPYFFEQMGGVSKV